MDNERKQRLGEVIAQAEAMPPAERDAFIREACAGDSEMEAEVRSLLEAVAGATGFLSSPTYHTGAEETIAAQVREAVGTTIGRYRLLQEIGEGGFGVVFLAEQREPVNRRVAIKIIKLGMDTKQVVARFEAERQALAMMDHPGIARVFDGGATETGRPYFVMELVRGDPITTHCNANRLGTPERLELFEHVCRAVQHAHTKGVIHRDLKPGNVLVTMVDGKPVPKIIDFGIAKATSARLTERTFFTEHRQFIGTPEYMSPEQADNSGVDVDARTDIYSLGVLLYELLTGVTPFDPAKLRSAAWNELLRIIREEEPQKPSTRLSTFSQKPGPQPGQPSPAAAGQVRGDLDWIVMRCLEKERARRYETAEALAADVRRHLIGEPVQAAPPSAVYRARKFIRRHRGPMFAASLLLITLIAGAAGTAVFAVLESRARTRAENAEATATRRADDLQKVAEFQRTQLRSIEPEQMGAHIREDLFAEARSAWNESRVGEADAAARLKALQDSLTGTNFTNIAMKTLDRNLFSQSIKAIHEQFKDQPLIRANLLYTVARTMSALGIFDNALPPTLEALEIRRRELGNENDDTIASISGAGDLYRSMGKLADSQKLFQEELDLTMRIHGKDHPSTLIAMSDMAAVLSDQRKFADADPYFSESLERSRKVLGDDDRETLSRMSSQAFNLRMRAKLPEAEGLCREAAERCRRVLGPDDRDTMTAVNMLGSLLWAEGKSKDAAPLIDEALATARRTLGDDNPTTLDYLFNSGAIFRDLGQHEESAKRLQEAYDRSVRVQGKDHLHTIFYVATLAEVQSDLREFDRSAESFSTALAGFQAHYGDADSKTLRTKRGLGVALTELGRFAEAEPLLIAAEAGIRPLKNPKQAATCDSALATLYEKWEAVEPGKGHAAAAAEWKARLQAIEVPAGPVNRDR